MPRAASSKVSTAAKATAKKPAQRRKANGYQMPEKIAVGEILTDLSKQQWKIGPSIGSGGFGEIYCACKANETPKKHEDYQYVVKIEPHGNGPLFVEMHFYMRNGKLADIEAFRKKNGLKILGMPHFVGHGSHELKQIKHRFIVMPRFGADIWSKFKANNDKLPLHTVYRLAMQMLDVYEYIHACTYIHGDLKGSNILLGYGKNGAAQAYLVDFGLAAHFSKELKPDPKKMHNGTIEYTSRDAHLGVSTMRGDLEILAYNLIQWSGGKLPWEVNKLLTNPLKVQQAKDDLMSDLNKKIKDCYGSQKCPEPIFSLLNYVTKLKFDEKPNYVKVKKEFQTALKSLGKADSGDLEFKLSASPAKTKVAKKDLSKITENTEDTENISPPGRKARATNKRISIIESDEDAETQSPSKRARGNSKTQKTNTQKSTTTSNDSSIVVNNHVNKTTTKTGTTYQLNFELDISFDANVVVNVKRKKKTSPEASKKTTKTRSLDQSTDEIPGTEESMAIGKAKVLKKAPRSSPRSKK